MEYLVVQFAKKKKNCQVLRNYANFCTNANEKIKR